MTNISTKLTEKTFQDTSVTKPEKWFGMELSYLTFVRYNGTMPIIDDDTIFEPGIQSGTANNMRVGISDNGRTLVQFVEYVSVTNDHVDKAKIVGDMQLHNVDLVNLIGLLKDRAEELGLFLPK